jgi:hypothetical protein
MTDRPAVALTALLVGLAVVMAVWLSIDRRPPEWDHPMAVSVAPISVGAGRLEVGANPDPLCPPKESR